MLRLRPTARVVRSATRVLTTGTAATTVKIAPATSYSTALSALHWIQAGGVITCIGAVLLAQRTPPEDKERKAQLMHIHKTWCV
jgi:hypothetical protein